jgi:signal transduction histidine kinase/ligand-binding sensor domain-containing protein
MSRLFFIILAFITAQAHGQASVEFARLGVNEGLSQNSVYGIYQDRQGFLWIGTGDGLNRYDGKRFTIYRARYNDTSGMSISGRVVTGGLTEDAGERLWFQTTAGIEIFDKKKERFIKPSRFNSQIAEFETRARLTGVDADGLVWLVDHTVGAISINPESWAVRHYPFSAFSPQNITAGSAIMDGNIYFTADEGLFCFDVKVKRYRLVRHISHISHLRLLEPGVVAVQGKGKVEIVDLSDAHSTPIEIVDEEGKPDAHFIVIARENPDVYYVSIQGVGLVRIELSTGRKVLFQNHPADPSSLSNNFITTAYIDRSRNLWIGTEGGGLSRMDLKPQKFKSFPSRARNSLQAANLMVKSITALNGKLLAGTFSQGLYIIDPLTGHFTRKDITNLPKPVSPNSINILQKDSDGRLWMNYGHALGYLDTNSFRFIQYAFIPDGDPRGNFAAYCLMEHEPGRFLVGTNVGLYRMWLEKGRPVFQKMREHNFDQAFIQSIEKAPDGTIFIGQIRNGFRRIRMDQNAITLLDSGFLNTGIRHFYFSPKHPYAWMATENGLIAWNIKTKDYKVFDETNGMSNSYIYAILPQNDTTLWMSTNKGLNKANVTYSANGNIASVGFQYHTQVHGLQSNEFNTGAFYRSEDGTMAFGGVNGINWFHPAQVITNTYKPALVLTQLRVNEKPFSGDLSVGYLESIELPYHRNTLAFRFAAIEYTNSAANQYAYMLEGFDKDWVYTQTIDESRYSNLPPGSYVFKVKASNGDGVWTDEALRLEVVILKPFWQTWWFRFLLALVLAAVAVLITRLFIAQKVRKKIRELEKQKAVNEERLRISRDMHDELGTGLTKLTLLSEVTRQKLKQHHESLPLQEISATSRQLTQKMGEIIWTLNPVNDTLDNLAAYLKEQVYEMCERSNLTIDINFPEEIPPLKLTNSQRQQVLLVTKEAFNNILKHAQAKRVQFSLELAHGRISFNLKDDGVGFADSPNIQPANGKRNGLSNMAWRMTQAGGEFHIKSKPGEGTEVRYSIAAG